MADILIIGGSGVISAHCTAALCAAGHRVTTFRRGSVRPTPAGTGFGTISGDRDDPRALAAAMAACNPEIVVDFACFTPPQAQVLLDVLPARCRQLVLVSTVDVHGLPLTRLPMAETDPPAPPASDYARDKRAVERLLTGAAAGRDLALTIVRPTYSMGDAFMISLFDRSGAELVARLRLGLPVLVPDAGRRLIHPSDARDTGRMIAATADARQALGRDYTVGTPGAAMTQAAYLGMIAGALGVPLRAVDVPSAALLGAGVLAPDSLWSELTCRDLAYDLTRFCSDFPDFRADPRLDDAVRAYAGRLDPAGDAARARGPEQRSLQALGHPDTGPRPGGERTGVIAQSPP